MTIETDRLIAELKARTEVLIKETEALKECSTKQLNNKSSAESWSALECIEHLNLYGDYYIPEIAERIKTSTFSSDRIFKSGIIGNYFTKSMLPKKKLNKMKTFKDKNPIGSSLSISTLDRFISQQTEFLELLDQSKSVSLNRTKTAISISRFIKLKLGDTFRFIVAHNERHLVQAKAAITNS